MSIFALAMFIGSCSQRPKTKQYHEMTRAEKEICDDSLLRVAYGLNGYANMPANRYQALDSLDAHIPTEGWMQESKKIRKKIANETGVFDYK